jgi:hypothetical protein
LRGRLPLFLFKLNFEQIEKCFRDRPDLACALKRVRNSRLSPLKESGVRPPPIPPILFKLFQISTHFSRGGWRQGTIEHEAASIVSVSRHIYCTRGHDGRYYPLSPTPHSSSAMATDSFPFDPVQALGKLPAFYSVFAVMIISIC